MKGQPSKELNAAHAEQSVIGALLLDNDALDRVVDLEPGHFRLHEHRVIFAEICRQVGAGKRCDVVSLYDAVHDQVDDCLPYLNQITQSVGSAVNIVRYAEIVIDRAIRRQLAAFGGELQEAVRGAETSDVLVDRAASTIDAISRRKTRQEPQRFAEMLGNYVDIVQARMDGTIKPISTGFAALDARLDGGVERGTLTIVAGRPSMGKTAMGLCLARNVAEWGISLFLSMEMPAQQVVDRNIAALGCLSLSWLKKPDDDQSLWTRMTTAFERSQALNLYIDDQTALNMLDIRRKARIVKRRRGLDMLVIDQLSFITGGVGDRWEVVGEYTRGLLQLAKELDIAVVLLCQLSREVEKRENKRPIMSDLALSGAIEQDAANIIFLYRGEVYDRDTEDKGICEVITAKQRQGEPGVVGLAYVGSQTRFEDLDYQWTPQVHRTRSAFQKGFR